MKTSNSRPLGYGQSALPSELEAPLEDTKDPKDAVVNDKTEDTASHRQLPRLLHWAQENNSTGVIKKCSV